MKPAQSGRYPLIALCVAASTLILPLASLFSMNGSDPWSRNFVVSVGGMILSAFAIATSILGHAFPRYAIPLHVANLALCLIAIGLASFLWSMDILVLFLLVVSVPLVIALLEVRRERAG